MTRPALRASFYRNISMKVFFRTIHLYLSLAAGLVIFGSCLTGTMLVFEKEIDRTLHPERYFVKPQAARLTLTELKTSALSGKSKAKPAYLTVYNNQERTVEVGVVMPEKRQINGEAVMPTSNDRNRGTNIKSKKHTDMDRANLIVFVNPYSGVVVGEYSRRQSFLFNVEMYHRFLLAGKDSAGDIVVGLTTLLFLFILLTGIILWWPKTKKIMKQRLKIKWAGSTKRLVHDLHLVTGFYTSIFLIITITTGLIMSFKWANKALFAITGSAMQTEPTKLPKSKYTAGIKPISIDNALNALSEDIAVADYYTIKTPKDSTGTFSITILPKGTVEGAADTYFIDQYSGQIAGKQLFADKSAGQRARAYIKPIHTGAIYGLPTKIISFIVCLLALIFPVTGVMMWLNRIKKKSRVKAGLA
jgi:uncharacterized iron-regulated membrane protein